MQAFSLGEPSAPSGARLLTLVKFGKPAMLRGISRVVGVPMFDASAKTTARARAIRRHVDRKIFRFSFWLGAIAALLAGIVYIGCRHRDRRGPKSSV